MPVRPDDEPLDQYLRRVGFSNAGLSYARRSWVNAAGEAIDQLSAQVSLAEMRDESTGAGDYRILDGYDRALAPLAADQAIRFNTVVTALAWDDHGVRVTAADGQVFTADHAIITLPLGVLQSDAVRFTPDLPPEKRGALHALRMGPALKLIYRFAAPIWPPGVMALYSPLNPPMWWTPSAGQPDAGQVIMAFATGDWARGLIALGEAGALAQGLRVLADELGRTPPPPLIARWVNWAADPYACGGYSAAPPGAAAARQILAQPLAGTLFWAGEATAPNIWAATVHGAYVSGQRAATEILSQCPHCES
ncbi:MAG: FAD-dependent oxidoreductase [Chloroflexi bacterium]|nr:FAD-dependent oxidoreductase [Chloroflexota bacterium]